ncbi:MAG: translocation/assembly module TamB domain-containing protein [Cyclobacteriaceae bacterium]|nr:translocation/assembly module TamB domain-containing protein [Cyclobacteriaceae bacterium]
MLKNQFATQVLKKILRISIWVIGGIAGLLIVLSLILLIPSVQTAVVNRIGADLSEKTGMPVRVGSVVIAFPKTIRINEILIQVTTADTLFFTDHIKVDVALLPLLRKQISISYLQISGLRGNVYRRDSDSAFNFSPLLNAFSTPQKTVKNPKPLDWDISLGELELKDVRLSYEDHLDSMFMNLDLGLLSLEAKSIDLEHMTFDLGNAALLNTSFSMRMRGSPEAGDQVTAEKSNLPFHVSIEDIRLDNIAYDLQIGHDDLSLKASVYHADAIPELFDLPGEKIQMREINIEGVDVALYIKSAPEEVEITREAVHEDFTFGNFGWDFLVHHATIKNTSCVMDLGEKSDTIVGMDYSHMAFSDFNVIADSIFFNKNHTGALVRSMSALERSGPQLSEMRGRFYMDNHGIFAKDVLMRMPESYVEGSASLGYPTLSKIGTDISLLEINSSLRGNISARDVLPFAPVIAEIPFLNQADGLQNIRIQTSGQLGNLEVLEATFTMENEGFFSGRCSVQGLPSTKLNVQFQLDSVYLSGNILQELAPDSLLPENFTLPTELFLQASGETNLVNGALTARLFTDLGNATLEMHQADSMVTAMLAIDSLHLGTIIGQPMLGKISTSTDATITMREFTPTAMTSSTNIHHLNFNNYSLTDILVDLAFHENTYNLGIQTEDPALQAKLAATISMEDSVMQLKADLHLDEANLQLLGIMDDPFTIGSDIAVDLVYKNPEISSTELRMQNTSLSNKNGSYYIDRLSLLADMDENAANFELQSDVVDAHLTGNTRISEISVAIIDQLDRHIAMPDSMLNPKSFIFDMNVDWKKPDFLAGFLFEELHDFDLSRFQAHYNDEQNVLTASVEMPLVRYSNMAFDTLSFHIDSHRDSTVASVKVHKIAIDSAILRNISIESAFSTENWKFRLETHDSQDNLKYKLHSQAVIRDSTVALTIDQNNLVIKYLPWFIPADNLIRFDKSTIMARNAVMSNSNQKISLLTENNELKLQLDSFRIRNIIGILEGDTTNRPIQGYIDGYVAIGKWPDYSSINAMLDVHEIKIQNKYLGNLHAEARSENQSTAFSVLLKNDLNSIEANGFLANKQDEKSLSMIALYDIDDVSSFQPFLEEYISNLKGKINGRLSVSGSLDKPRFLGNIKAEDLGGTITALDGEWAATGEITIAQNRFKTDSFFLRDMRGNKLTLSGSIDGAELSNPYYDVKLQTENFFLVDRDVQAENMLSGKLAMALNIKVTGYFSDLNVTAGLKINKETDAVYTMPGKELELITDKGVVVFVDFDQSLEDVPPEETFSLQDSITDLLQGVNLTADISVDPEAKFTVIIDPNSGDFTKFNVNGKLNYVFNKNTRGQLTGLLELKSGFYELSFYGLVKKRFDFVPGSTVNWDGDIMEGDINFSARYTVKTNSVGLVSNQISSYEKALYNQRLPYDVVLYVKDKISYPVISFGIDLPQTYRSNYPTLDTKLNILNQPSMESERNKQVFALLVGGTFIPENPDVSEGSTSQSFATTAAINSVNAIMTQQLNNLTGQFIKNFDLDMGVNTFDDYSTGNAQTRTQLDVKVSKTLFNDRVSAEVESHINLDGSNTSKGTQSDAGQTEFAVSYKLTPSGNYRIKAFRENAYDIFDGEIQNSGLAFIFVREFDSFATFRQKATSPADSTTTNTEEKPIEK